MNKLEELLKETDFTQEEWNTFKKVEKHNQLEDLQYLLDEMLEEEEEITQEQYNEAVEEAKWIIERFDSNLEYDWRTTMEYEIKNAIGE